MLQIILVPFLIITSILSLIKPAYSDSYSKSNYTSSSLLKYPHFFQLSSKDIIGVTSSGKITFLHTPNNENKYTYTSDNSINFIDIEATLNSKNELRTSNNEIYIPCAKKGNDVQALSKINLSSKTVSSYSITPYILSKTNNSHCGISQVSDQKMVISFATSPFLNVNMTKIIGLIYHNNASLVEELFRYNLHVLGVNDKTEANCVYYPGQTIYLCPSLDSEEAMVSFNSLTSTGQFPEGNTYLLYYGKYSTFNNRKIFCVHFTYFKDETAILITIFKSNEFYVHFIKINSYYINTDAFYYTDEVVRTGDMENTKFLKLNEMYFIIFSSMNENVIQLYLFNFDTRKQINIQTENYLQTSFSDIFFSYDSKKLILINQVKEKYVEVYEISLTSCNERISAEYYLDLKKFVISIDEEEIDLDSYESLSVAFLEISNYENKNFTLFGVLENQNTDDYAIIQTPQEQNYYKKIKFNSYEKENFEIPFKYLVKRKFHSMSIPSFTCDSYLSFSCYKSCETCISFGNQTDNYCKKCKDGYYPKKEEYNDSYFNCYNNLESYYLDNDERVFIKCYDSCLSCKGEGNSTVHNCTECKEGKILLSYYTGNQSDSNCIDYCNNSVSTWYIDITNNSFVCRNNLSDCPEDYKILIPETNECIIGDNEEHIVINTTKEVNNTNSVDDGDDDDSIINLLINNASIFLESGQMSFNYSKERFKIDFYTSENMTIWEHINISKDCEDKLNEKYDNSFYLSLITIYADYYPTDQIEYLFFNKNGEVIDLTEICPNQTISIVKEIKEEFINERAIEMMKKYNINSYDKNDSFFNDYCQSFKSDNGTDTPISIRREDYFLDVEICENECSVGDYDYEKNQITCICQIKNNISTEIHEREKQTFENEVSTSSLKYFNCYKNVFTKRILTNPGFITVIGLTSVKFVSYGFLIKGIKAIKAVASPPIKIKKSSKSRKKGKKATKDKTKKNNQIDSNAAPNLKSKSSKENSKIHVMKLLQNVNEENQNQINNTPKIDKSKGDNFENSKSPVINLNPKSFFSNQNNQIKRLSIHDPQNENKESNDKIVFNFNGYTSKMKIETQSDKVTLIDIMKLKIIEIRTFTNNKENPFEKFVKIVGYLSYLSLILFINTLLYSDNVISNNYRGNSTKFQFKNEYKKIIISCIFGIVIILLYRAYSYFIKKCGYKGKLIFIMILTILDFFLVYYVSSFTGTNETSASNVVICTILTLCFNFLISFIFVMIIYVLRLIAIKTNSHYIYFIIEILIVV